LEHGFGIWEKIRIAQIKTNYTDLGFDSPDASGLRGGICNKQISFSLLGLGENETIL
jgi:hypothetical protein